MEVIGRRRFWDDSEWLPCRDGKSRRAQRGIFPLAARISKGVVRDGDTIIAPDDSGEARTLRLRGYGNSICVPLAAIFVRCVMDELGIQSS